MTHRRGVRAFSKDLETLASLIQDRKIKIHTEKPYSYKKIPEAINYIEAIRTKGKVAMVWENVNGSLLLGCFL